MVARAPGPIHDASGREQALTAQVFCASTAFMSPRPGSRAFQGIAACSLQTTGPAHARNSPGSWRPDESAPQDRSLPVPSPLFKSQALSRRVARPRKRTNPQNIQGLMTATNCLYPKLYKPYQPETPSATPKPEAQKGPERPRRPQSLALAPKLKILLEPLYKPRALN